MSMTIYDTIIIGAGISGLTLAFRLQSAGVSVLVLEAADQVGGVMKSTALHTPFGEAPIELGPNTVPGSAEAFLAIAREVGLDPVPSDPSAKTRYLFLNQRLTPLPSNPVSFLTSDVLSPIGKLAILQDLYTPVQSQQEISIARFFEKRFGREVLDNIITPALTGIYAGNPEEMSLQASFPFLATWEQESGSVIRGGFKAFKDRRKAAPSAGKGQQLISFPSGMAALPNALAHHLGETALQLNTPVTDIQTQDKLYKVHAQTGPYYARSVVLATAANVGSNLLKGLMPEAAQLLSQVPHAPMNLVYLAFDKTALPFQWDGFGFLVPRKQHEKPYVSLLGGIWNSCIFPDRYPSRLAVATHFQGGMFHPEASDLPDNDLIQKTVEELKTVYRTDSLTPIASLAKRWPTAIPQYTLGHRERLQKATRLLEKELPNLFLLGNYQAGVSLNDCVKNANQLAEALCRMLKPETLA